MKVCTVYGELSPFSGGERGLQRLREEAQRLCGGDDVPLRLVVADTVENRWRCELDTLQGAGTLLPGAPSIFSFRQRRWERSSAFTAVMLVPTGIDCAIGGHAGDATPTARLLASLCDDLIVNPNVVNASDVNEQTDNCLYVEGSLICRLMMGTISLRRVRGNRIVVITEARDDGSWAVDQVVNTVSAARATLGTDGTQVIVLRQPLSMTLGRSPTGRAIGDISGLEELFAFLRSERAHYDAVALATRITPGGDASELFQSYFRDEVPNPWGGVEAALTHTVSTAFDVPSAHAPTMEAMALRTVELGRVDVAKAAEAISTGYMFCLLKGLQRAPAVVPHPDGSYDPGVIAAEDVSCLVIPDGCVGLPVIAALLQGIPVIAVRSNTSIMRNDLRRLPFAPGQLWSARSYLEAAGFVAAIKAGVHPTALSRPLAPTTVVE